MQRNAVIPRHELRKSLRHEPSGFDMNFSCQLNSPSAASE